MRILNQSFLLQLVLPGLVVLGIIKEVKDLSLVLSLPNRHEASIAITQICDAYTDQLEKLAEGETNQVFVHYIVIYSKFHFIKCEIHKLLIFKMNIGCSSFFICWMQFCSGCC